MRPRRLAIADVAAPAQRAFALRGGGLGNRRRRDPALPGQVAGTTAGAALETELAVRDYLNEGGKLLVSGQYALFAQGANGSYVYHPDAPPECTDAVAASCLPLFADFQQYWLGAHTYVSDGGAGPEESRSRSPGPTRRSPASTGS